MTAVKTANSYSDSDLNLKASEHTGRCQTLSPGSKIFIAGHRGMVGSAIVRRVSEAAEKSREKVLDEIGDYVAELVAALE